MDFQRLLILMGLAVTAYMLILAWNEDYGAGGRLITEKPEPVTEMLQAPSEVNSAGDIPAMDDESDMVTDIVPRLEEPEQSLRRLTTESRLVDMTDVLEVQIDLTGDITRQPASISSVIGSRYSVSPG